MNSRLRLTPGGDSRSGISRLSHNLPDRHAAPKCRDESRHGRQECPRHECRTALQLSGGSVGGGGGAGAVLSESPVRVPPPVPAPPPVPRVAPVVIASIAILNICLRIVPLSITWACSGTFL